jgi:hypothetical protein
MQQPLQNQIIQSPPDPEHFNILREAIKNFFQETDPTKRKEYDEFIEDSILNNKSHIFANCHFLLGLLK